MPLRRGRGSGSRESPVPVGSPSIDIRLPSIAPHRRQLESDVRHLTAWRRLRRRPWTWVLGPWTSGSGPRTSGSGPPTSDSRTVIRSHDVGGSRDAEDRGQCRTISRCTRSSGSRGRMRMVGGSHVITCRIGIGGSGRSPLLPSHTTGHAGPHPAVQRVEVCEASRGTPSRSK